MCRWVGGTACEEIEDRACGIRLVADVHYKMTEFYSMTVAFYYMRDSILSQSTNGLEIIDKYEKASPYLADSISSVDLPTMWGFIELLHDKAEFLIANPTSSTILLDETTANDLLGVISDIRGFSTDTEWEECLDYFETLINDFTESSAAEVYSFITS